MAELAGDDVERGVGKRQLLDVALDSYPYIYSSTRLLILFPDWAHDGGPEKLKAVMRSDDGRERLRNEVGPRALSWQDMWLTYFKRPHNHQYEGRSIAEVAAMRDEPEVDALCELLLDEDLQVSYVSAGSAAPRNRATLARAASYSAVARSAIE